MKSLTRKLLLILLAVSCLAAWSWFRPYQWNSPEAARLRISEAALVKDHQNCWLKLHLEHRAGSPEHDWSQPIALVFPDGRRKRADRFERTQRAENGQIESLEIAFWLDLADLQNPLQLEINGEKLTIKTSATQPDWSGTLIKRTCNW